MTCGTHADKCAQLLRCSDTTVAITRRQLYRYDFCLKILIFSIFSPKISYHPLHSIHGAQRCHDTPRLCTTDVDNSVLVFDAQTVSDLNAKRDVPSSRHRFTVHNFKATEFIVFALLTRRSGIVNLLVRPPFCMRIFILRIRQRRLGLEYYSDEMRWLSAQYFTISTAGVSNTRPSATNIDR